MGDVFGLTTVEGGIKTGAVVVCAGTGAVVEDGESVVGGLHAANSRASAKAVRTPPLARSTPSSIIGWTHSHR
jgi:hypothetical protein